METRKPKLGSQTAYPVLAGSKMSMDNAKIENFTTTGMSKREFIAAMALQGAIAHSGMTGEMNDTSEITAQQCLKYTDALLAALEKTSITPPTTNNVTSIV